MDLNRAKQMIPTSAGPKLLTRRKNEIIHNAWLEMASSTPWTVEKFIKDLSSYEVDLFDTPVQSKYILELSFCSSCVKSRFNAC